MIQKRHLYAKLQKHLPKKQYTIIIGARQVGKTTLLKLLAKDLRKKHKNVFEISLESADILNQINENPENIFKYIQRDSKAKTYLLIDEIQYAKNPTNFLKYLYDKYEEKIKIIATGSSAFYIDKKFTDALTGRKRIFHLKTLNFREFLQFKDKHDLYKELEIISKKHEYISLKYSELMDLFNEYTIYGGYPEVVLENDNNEKIELLKEIKNSYLKKDIYESRIEYEEKFYNLLTILSSRTGNLLNTNELSSVLQISNKTIQNYLYILRKSFHIDLLRPFYSNINKELIKMPKIYFNDLGLRNILINNFENIENRIDKGELFENYVYIRLTEKYNADDIKFWRQSQGNEIDFIVSETYNKGKAYEVKFNSHKYNQSKYKKFSNHYKNYKLSCICYDYREEEKFTPIIKL